MNKDITNEIIKLVKENKIKSITIDSEHFDFSNIPESIDNTRFIQLSKKYIPFLVPKFELDNLKDLLPNNLYNLMVITDKNKLIAIQVTHHSAWNFIKRFLYTYLLDTHAFEISNKNQKVFLEYFNKFFELYKLDKRDLGDNKDVLDCMKFLLNESSFFDYKSTGRLRDYVAFKDRENKNTVRYLAHPFLFIVQDERLRTVELYSSCYDFRNANKFIKSIKFDSWLDKKIRGYRDET